MVVFFRSVMLLILLSVAPLSNAYAQNTTRILLFGDSITAGYGLDEEHALPVRLEAYLQAQGQDVSVINGGVSGDTTSGGRSRLEWTVDRNSPDIVVIALGGNDVLRGIPPEMVKNNIDAMLSVLQQQEITTILSSVQAPNNLGLEYQQSFNAVYTDLAKEYDVPLYPFLLEDVFGKEKFMQSDGIHPSEAGVEVIAEGLGEYLVKFLMKE